jgi:hypothetical protein
LEVKSFNLVDYLVIERSSGSESLVGVKIPLVLCNKRARVRTPFVQLRQPGPLVVVDIKLFALVCALFLMFYITPNDVYKLIFEVVVGSKACPSKEHVWQPLVFLVGEVALEHHAGFSFLVVVKARNDDDAFEWHVEDSEEVQLPVHSHLLNIIVVLWVHWDPKLLEEICKFSLRVFLHLYKDLIQVFELDVDDQATLILIERILMPYHSNRRVNTAFLHVKRDNLLVELPTQLA